MIWAKKLVVWPVNMAKWPAHVRVAADPDGGVLLWLMTVTMTTPRHRVCYPPAAA